MSNVALGSTRKELFVWFTVHLVKATQAPDGVVQANIATTNG